MNSKPKNDSSTPDSKLLSPAKSSKLSNKPITVADRLKQLKQQQEMDQIVSGKNIIDFESLVKEHGFIKARHLLQSLTIREHQDQVAKAEKEKYEAQKPQRVKDSIALSFTSGTTATISILDKVLQSNNSIQTLERALQRLDPKISSKALIGAIKANEKAVHKDEAKVEFLKEEAFRHAVVSSGAELLMANQDLQGFPESVGETFLLQTAHILKINCARNNFRMILDGSQLPQLSIYQFRFVRELNFSLNKLVRIPDGIGVLKTLETLNLSGNLLSKLPTSFYQLTSLKTLDLSSNNFDHLPDEFSLLDGLTHLNMSQNLFKTFPHAVVKLRNITVVNFSRNTFTHLGVLPPLLKKEDMWMPSIDRYTGKDIKINILTRERVFNINFYTGEGIQHQHDLHVFQRFGTRNYRRRKMWLSVCQIHEWMPAIDSKTGQTFYQNNVSGDCQWDMPLSLDTIGNISTLVELSLTNNSITSLPDSFSKLTHLVKANLKYNRLRELPSDIGNMKKLQFLDVSSNELKYLPVTLCDCSELKQLLLTDNHLLRLPDNIGYLPNLINLELSSNRLRQIPYTLGYCKTMMSIQIAENPMEDPPLEEFNKPLEQLKWYLRGKFLVHKQGKPPVMQYHQMGIDHEVTIIQPELIEAVQQQISASKKDGFLSLQLMGIKEIPAPVIKMKELKRLKLDFNPNLLLKNGIPPQFSQLLSISMRACGLCVLPENVYHFELLTSLTLNENNLEYLPDTISEMQFLTYLDLSKNKLYQLPESFTKLSKVKTLNLESNRLSELPEQICEMTEISVLNLSKNRLTDVPETICKLKSIRVLNLEKNRLARLPKSIKLMQVVELRVGHNRLEELSNDLFSYSLGQSLHLFSCCENNLMELPSSITQLKQQSVLEADYNPLVSPPSHLLSEGFLVVQHYLEIREDRRRVFVELMEDEDFVLNKQGFHPVASEVVEDGSGFLSPEDLAEFDQAVHEFLNGEYFKCPATAEEIVAAITLLREQRETELYLAIIRTFLKVLKRISEEKDEAFTNASVFSEERPWGRDGENSNVWVVSLTALLRDTAANELYPLGKPSIFSLISKALPHIPFPFTVDLLKDSLRLYVSPYGPIANTEQVTFPACDCMDEKRQRPRRHDPCVKPAVILSKSVFTEDEAERREVEEEEFIERFEEVDFSVRIWLLTEEGQKAMNKEVKRRKAVLKEEIILREEMLLSQQLKLRKCMEVLNDLNTRKELFESGAPYENHRLHSVEDAIKLIGKKEEEAEGYRGRCDILRDAADQLKEQLMKDWKTCCAESAADLIHKYCYLAYQKRVIAYRRIAASHDWYRHWDGEDGDAYEDWRKKFYVASQDADRAVDTDNGVFSNDNNTMNVNQDDPVGLQRATSTNSLHSTTSMNSDGDKSTKDDNATKDEFEWTDTDTMEKFKLKIFDRFRSMVPFIMEKIK